MDKVSANLNRFVIDYKGNNNKIISFDRTLDSVYEFVHEDSLTSSGWKIQYMIKDDSTRLKDIYIKITKDNYSRFIQCPDILEFRPTFLPRYSGETNRYLIFEHWCATDCQALTLIPKNNEELIITFEGLLEYDEKKGILVYIDEKSYEGHNLIISAFNLKTGKAKSIIFKNKCYSITLSSCIDSITFNVDAVTVTNWFVNEHGNDAKETKTIKF